MSRYLRAKDIVMQAEHTRTYAIRGICIEAPRNKNILQPSPARFAAFHMQVTMFP